MTAADRREAVDAQKRRTGLSRMRHAFGYSLAGLMQPSYQPQLEAELCAACHQDKNDPDEDFVTEEVQKGRSIIGLYPATQQQAKDDFAAWSKARGR